MVMYIHEHYYRVHGLGTSVHGGPHHVETSPLIYLANQWTDFYITRTSVM